MSVRSSKPAFRARWICGLLLATGAIGCAALEPETGRLAQDFRGAGLTSRQVRLLLNDFVRRFSDEVTRSADSIVAASPSDTVTRNALLWKLGAVPAAYRAGTLEDGLAAFRDLWILSAQMRELFEEGGARAAFGPLQDAARATSARLHDEIEAVARRIARSDAAFDAEREWVDRFAASAPIEELSFSRRSVVPEYLASVAGERPAFFQAVENLGDNLAALQELIVAFAAQLPAVARWQAELMLLDVRTNERMVRTLVDFDGMDRSLVRMADVAEQAQSMVGSQAGDLFANLAREREALFTEIEKLRAVSFEGLENERREIFAAIAAERAATLAEIEKQRSGMRADIEAMVRAAGEQTEAHGRELIDRAFHRALQLVAAAAVAALLFLLVSRVIPRRPT